MLAVDTNILVRFLTRDEPKAVVRVNTLLRTQQVWIPKTVLLETEWVLRTAYGYERDRLLQAFRGLVGLTNVHLEDALAVSQAMDWLASGLEFADALHLASCGEAEGFVTFDKALVRQAKALAPIEVSAL